MRNSFYDEEFVVEQAAGRLMWWAAMDYGLKWPDARRHVAREAGVAPGALERLQNRTLVHKDRISGRLHALLVKTLERKVTELGHELEIARQLGERHRGIDVVGAEAALAKARKALGVK